MSTQEIGSVEKNVHNLGGGSFALGLGIPVRESFNSPPIFPDADIQVSINPSSGTLEVWNKTMEVWVNTMPKVYYSQSDGTISDSTLLKQRVVGVIGSGTSFIGNTEPGTGLDFVKSYESQVITLESGSFVPNSPYLLIFGI